MDTFGMLNSYLKRIFDVTKHGDAREESYYSGLEELIKNCAESSGKKKTHVTTLPKKTEAGNPDFRIWDGQQSIVGYIEAKPPTEENLDHIEETAQLTRYRHTFPNLILTNFFEFRLYRDGQLVDRVQMARPFIVHKLKTVPPVEKEAAFLNLLEQFFAFSLPKSYSAKTLAIELAKRTRFLKDQVIAEELREEAEKGTGHILGFYEAFQKHLISGLTKEDFADLYAQTIAYGLFAARTRSENGFSRKLAFDFIPPTIGILRDVFRFISMGDLPQQMEWIVDDISQVLATADVKQILHKYFHEGKGKDPIIHFYETFLAEYDPAERERRGVYYTPEPVVSYITRSLHAILKDYFSRTDGFATKSVTVLDPAGGTLTFPAEASKLAVAEFVEKYGSGGRSSFIEHHILKNFYAFELMMASYAVGHLKMSFLLEELGYRLKKEDRFKLYLTNTLEMEELAQSKLPGMSSLAEESRLAGKVKKETPILVILGNPPYSGHSSNIGDWISTEIKAYYQVDGKPLGEKNPKWLQDDYVKFIRFAQWKIDQAGEGVLGFITNHSYLDNPTFRGMRQSLMTSFDHIYLLDLHGNSLKKERCPDGSEDKNVFDIRQGVAIGLFIKQKGLKKKVVHAERWGLREDKYEWLLKHDHTTTKWQPIKPKSEFYLFVPRDEATLDRYNQYPKMTEIFPVNSVGIVTARDSFAIDFDKAALKRRIAMFRDTKMPDDLIRQTFGLVDSQAWDMPSRRKAIIADEDWKEKIVPCLYRPFDTRWIFYHDEVIERPRKEEVILFLVEIEKSGSPPRGIIHGTEINVRKEPLMKNTTRKRKKALRGFEAADGRQELIDQMYHLFASGKQGFDACMKDLGRMMAETIMYIEREEIAGPDYRPFSADIQKWASQPGSVYIGDQKIPADHPRLRGPQGEIALRSYQRLKEPEGFSEELLGKVLRGLSCRKYAETVVEAANAFGVSASSVSRHLVAATAKQLRAFKERSLTSFAPFAVFLDTVHRGGEAFIVALGIDTAGEKRALGFWQGATENHDLGEELLADMARRGLALSRNVIWVTDGGKGIIKALRDRFGKKLIHQRCTIHKDRNIQRHLPKKYRKEAHRRFRTALEQNQYSDARQMLLEMERWLRGLNESAADSLMEAIDDMLTLHRLNVPSLLRKTLHSTNPIESLFSTVRDAEGNIKRYRNSGMMQRWLASVLLYSEKGFRRIKGHALIPAVIGTIEAEEVTLRMAA